MNNHFPRVYSISKKVSYLVLGLITLGMAGCGVRHVKGGTKGVLHVDGELVGEIQVTVHRVGGSATEPIGVGTTNNEGSFELLQPGAQGALWLTPGEYRFTLETIGPPIRFPKEYTKAETTSLKATWTTDDRELNLDATTTKRR